MSCVRVLWLAPLLLAACSFGPTMPPGVTFLDPGVRAGQERACAAAVARERGVPAETVAVRRASSDPRNHSIVNVVVGPVSGYCRVTADFRVLQVAF